MNHYVIGAIGGVIFLFGVILVGVMVIDDRTQDWDDGDFLP